MKTCEILVAPALVLAAVAAPAPADADVRGQLVEQGLNVSVGGGLVQFVDRGMRGFATEGGAWEARIAYGTKTPLTFEAAYLGSLHAIDALGLDTGASLLGTGLEASFRLNATTGDLQPYVLAGLGWTRYSLVGTSTNTSDVSDRDDLGSVPVGLGLSFRQGSLTLDLRAVYRAAIAVDMFAGSTDASLASWSGTLRAGFEY